MLEGLERNSNPDEAICYQGHVLIPDVIGRICKFLSTQDIRRCRLVSQSWNYGATPVLKDRTRTTLEFYPEDIFEVENKLKFCPINVRLLTVDQPFPLNPAIYPPITNLKSVHFENGFSTWKEFCFTRIILTSFRTLEKLRFDWHSCTDLPSFGATIFPKLRKLGIKIGSEWDQDVVERIGQAVTEALRVLECIKITSEGLYEISRMGFLPPFPLTLNSVDLDGNFGPNQIECLQNIPASLKKLGFTLAAQDDNGGMELAIMVYQMLKRHAPTLEKLSIRDNMTSGLEWKVPVFPTLKKFTLIGDHLSENVEFETRQGNFGGIDYDLIFPVLENLTIYSDSYQVSSVAAFLPVENYVVETVKKVDIRIYGSEFIDINLGILPLPDRVKRCQAGVYTRLLEIFPNARESLRKRLRALFL